MQDKKTLLMEKWIEALESDKYKQIHNKFFGYEENEVCAVGVAIRVSETYGLIPRDNTTIKNTEDILGNSLAKKVQFSNDGGLTFKEIAAKLRAGEYE